jgi:hypothetical protein
METCRFEDPRSRMCSPCSVAASSRCVELTLRSSRTSWQLGSRPTTHGAVPTSMDAPRCPTTVILPPPARWAEAPPGPSVPCPRPASTRGGCIGSAGVVWPTTMASGARRCQRSEQIKLERPPRRATASLHRPQALVDHEFSPSAPLSTSPVTTTNTTSVSAFTLAVLGLSENTAVSLNWVHPYSVDGRTGRLRR